MAPSVDRRTFILILPMTSPDAVSSLTALNKLFKQRLDAYQRVAAAECSALNEGSAFLASLTGTPATPAVAPRRMPDRAALPALQGAPLLQALKTALAKVQAGPPG
jgi:hypothetical protein